MKIKKVLISLPQNGKKIRLMLSFYLFKYGNVYSTISFVKIQCSQACSLNFLLTLKCFKFVLTLLTWTILICMEMGIDIHLYWILMITQFPRKMPDTHFETCGSQNYTSSQLNICVTYQIGGRCLKWIFSVPMHILFAFL